MRSSALVLRAVSGQPLLTHGAEKAQGAAAAILAPAPYLALDEDKKGKTNTERRCPKDAVHGSGSRLERYASRRFGASSFGGSRQVNGRPKSVWRTPKK